MATGMTFSVLLRLMALHVGEYTVHVVMYYISTDATLTSANLHSALASLSDDELRRVLGVSSGGLREKWITDFMMRHYSPTWEWVAGRCFYHEEEQKALEKVKKYFKRKLGMLLIILYRAHMLTYFKICA